MAELLTLKEIETLKSMSRYWDEVNQRDNKFPLEHEIQQVYQMLGVRLLFIVSDCVNVRPDLYAALEELVDIVDNSPEDIDSFTTQPAKTALSKADKLKGDNDEDNKLP